jgi:hypothetical protein
VNRWYVLAALVLVAGLVWTFQLPAQLDCPDTTIECGDGISRFFAGSVTVILACFFGLIGFTRNSG